jgi:hypothetical protein
MTGMLGALVLAAATSFGNVDVQPEGPDEALVKDKVRYRSLTRQIREIDRKYSQVLDMAMEEAHGSETGEASLETQAELLALKGKRDRLNDRVTVLALRHGWDLPGLDVNQSDERSALSGTEEVFAASSAIVRQGFVNDAREIAGRVELPVISLGGL